jgi:hypothetical protein
MEIVHLYSFTAALLLPPEACALHHAAVITIVSCVILLSSPLLGQINHMSGKVVMMDQREHINLDKYNRTVALHLPRAEMRTCEPPTSGCENVCPHAHYIQVKHISLVSLHRDSSARPKKL